MTKKIASAEPEVEETFSLDDVQMFRITFRRKPPVMPNQARTKVYLTFGLTERDAVARVWDTFRGTSFQTDFHTEDATAELVIGRILKIGG